MTHSRRSVLKALAVAAPGSALASLAWASGYPSGPIKLMVGFPAGNAPDMVARMTGAHISALLGTAVIVENRVGAASTLAAQAVASATPDGQTLLQITPANAINPDLHGGKNFVTDIAPVGLVARGPMVVVVQSSFPVQSFGDLVHYMGAHPDKTIVGSPQTGSTPYLAAALFKMLTGINFLHVPFGGTSQAVTEMLAGRVQVVFADMSANGLIQSGKIRALAVTSAKRQDAMPNVPTIAESVAGYEAGTWYGIGAPKNTPAEVVQILNSCLGKAVVDPTVKARLATFGLVANGSSPEGFSKLIVAETEKWAKVSKFVQAS